MNDLLGSGSEKGSIRSKLCSISGYDPETISYKVRADDGNVYTLRQRTSTPDGEWELVSFRWTG